MSPAEAEKARRAAMNTIEQESAEKTGLRSDVVTLYHGGLYHLYRYKKYTDVRLVFAPEQAIAFFGGDPDNFEYPRYDLDICFFRVYENGKPAQVEHYLKWSTPGRGDGELVFVSGPSGPDRPAGHGGPPGVPPRRVAARQRCACSAAARCSCRPTASGAERTPGGPRRTCSASRTPARPARAAGRPAGPGGHGRKRAEEKALRERRASADPHG